jgi:putative SOS response-associated peptidase YedK
MCARFSLETSEKEILKAYSAEHPGPFTPDNNITITDETLLVTADEPTIFQKMHFRVVPWFAKSPEITTNDTFNARDDKIMSSKLWRPLFMQHKRCIILADKFYEKDRLMHPEENQNYGFNLVDREVFPFAGLWSKWVSKDPTVRPYYSFSIITTDSNELVGEIHDKKRMPVILRNKYDVEVWLSKDVSPDLDLIHLFKPYPDDLMNRFKVPKFARKVKAGNPGSENSL